MISFGLDNDAAGIADAKFRSDERAGHIHCVAKEKLLSISGPKT